MRRNLWRATFTNGYIRRYVKIAPHSRTFVAFSGKQVMGWAFVFRLTGENGANFFVNERYRRQGVAMSLAETMLKKYDTIVVSGWDVVSKRFFKKLQEKYPERVKITAWNQKERTKHGRFLKQFEIQEKTLS